MTWQHIFVQVFEKLSIIMPKQEEMRSSVKGTRLFFCQVCQERESLVWWKDLEVCRKCWICILIPSFSCSETLHKEVGCFKLPESKFCHLFTRVDSHLVCGIVGWNKGVYQYNALSWSGCLVNAIYTRRTLKRLKIKLQIVFFKSIFFYHKKQNSFYWSKI